jgi:hypothetical protein
MTTATVPTFSTKLCATLDALLGQGSGALIVDARTEGGLGHNTLLISTPSFGFLPVGMLRLLEGRSDWHVRVSPAVRDQSTGDPVRLNALFARFVLEPEFSAATDWTHRVSPQRVDEIARRLATFAVKPSIIIDGYTEVVALWLLDEPLSLRTSAERERAIQLQRRLAVALGASTDAVTHMVPSATGGDPLIEKREACDPLSFVPLAGIVRELGLRGPRTLIDIAAFNRDRIASVAAIAATLGSQS